MDLFKRVRCEWETELDKTPVNSDASLLLKRQRTRGDTGTSPPRCVKRQRLDSDSLMFLSDHYWPDDVHHCGF